MTIDNYDVDEQAHQLIKVLDMDHDDTFEYGLDLGVIKDALRVAYYNGKASQSDEQPFAWLAVDDDECAVIPKDDSDYKRFQREPHLFEDESLFPIYKRSKIDTILRERVEELEKALKFIAEGPRNVEQSYLALFYEDKRVAEDALRSAPTVPKSLREQISPLFTATPAPQPRVKPLVWVIDSNKRPFEMGCLIQHADSPFGTYEIERWPSGFGWILAGVCLSMPMLTLERAIEDAELNYYETVMGALDLS